ncbi:DNA-processing protein DprA [Agromyces sp. SYSU K20354]|uniref:DNA-processing protein DprA n=1 Tax=Agromyces cavernae TaxID=2898659 RepID=UPI001E5CBB3D|nr:DNA-processing protein DprA [Agromyces cavernae]MCD2442429.1 DNA-processing protein DprA [Agromyces cavernae]
MNTIQRLASEHREVLAVLRPRAVRDLRESLEPTARIVLGVLAEPGDGVLGRVVSAVGAVGAAELLLARCSAQKLVDVVGDAGEAISPKEAEDGLKRWTPRVDQMRFTRSIGQASRVGARFLFPGDAEWPAGLHDLERHAPLGLWVRGRIDVLAGGAPSIALVGARAATGYGEHVAGEASAGLSDRGFVVVSGGAYGIDGMAHRAALASDGTTVAFLAGGIDRFYPMGHESLLTRIASSNGAVVSEVPCGTAPTKWRFLERNRLIAAASDATVVLEAGLRSGSINTAGHASALGRPLGAVPGPVTSPASAGCHRLLREYDAVCVVDAAQMAELAIGAATPTLAGLGPGWGGVGETPDGMRVLDELSTRTPRELGEIVQRSGVVSSKVMSVLGELEADGVVVRRDGRWLRRRTAC